MPIIGISCSFLEEEQRYVLPKRYAEALQQTGALPVILPYLTRPAAITRLAEELDGLVLSGGADVPPAWYGEQSHATCQVVPLQRVEFERAMICEFMDREKPILGICYGCQLLNVVLGGTLYQHLPDQRPGDVDHGTHRVTACHAVTLRPATRLAGLFSRSCFEVVSSHHQGVRECASPLRIAAESSDGLVEAIEHPGQGFVIGVQWHPEMEPDGKETRNLFRAFVKEASLGTGKR